MLLFWITVFVISIAALIKGADWLLDSAEKIGVAVHISPFVIGAVLVGIGTSLPELVSSIAAAIQGSTEIIVANAIGSNIANILLVIGISAILSRKLTVDKDLLDIDIPLLATTTIIFLGTAWDAKITFGESVILLLTCAVYLGYNFAHREKEYREEVERGQKLTQMDFVVLAAGIITLIFGAKYAIEAITTISQITNIGTEVISLLALAFGTSLPELIVSVRATLQGKHELALGNIFGSNVFNLVAVVGIPGLFVTIPLDEKTFLIGLPFLAGATFVFIFSSMSKKIFFWEGAMYLVLYILFATKLFGLL